MRKLILLASFALLCAIPSKAACSNTAYGTATCIQAASNSNGGAGNTVTATLSSTGAGHLIVIHGHWCGNSSCNTSVTPASASVSDSGCAETYHVAAASTGTTGGGTTGEGTWYVFNSKGGCTSITLTYSGANFWHIMVSEWSGPSIFATTNSYDQGNVTNSGSGCSTCTVSTAGSTANPNELVVGTLENTNGSNVITPVAPSSTVVLISTHSGMAAKTVSSTGTQSVSWTQTIGGATVNMTIATFNLGSSVVPRQKMGPF